MAEDRNEYTPSAESDVEGEEDSMVYCEEEAEGSQEAGSAGEKDNESDVLSESTAGQGDPRFTKAQVTAELKKLRDTDIARSRDPGITFPAVVSMTRDPHRRGTYVPAKEELLKEKIDEEGLSDAAAHYYAVLRRQCDLSVSTTLLKKADTYVAGMGVKNPARQYYRRGKKEREQEYGPCFTQNANEGGKWLNRLRLLLKFGKERGFEDVDRELELALEPSNRAKQEEKSARRAKKKKAKLPDKGGPQGMAHKKGGKGLTPVGRARAERERVLDRIRDAFDRQSWDLSTAKDGEVNDLAVSLRKETKELKQALEKEAQTKKVSDTKKALVAQYQALDLSRLGVLDVALHNEWHEASNRVHELTMQARDRTTPGPTREEYRQAKMASDAARAKWELVDKVNRSRQKKAKAKRAEEAEAKLKARMEGAKRKKKEEAAKAQETQTVAADGREEPAGETVVTPDAATGAEAAEKQAEKLLPRDLMPSKPGDAGEGQPKEQQQKTRTQDTQGKEAAGASDASKGPEGGQEKERSGGSAARSIQDGEAAPGHTSEGSHPVSRGENQTTGHHLLGEDGGAALGSSSTKTEAEDSAKEPRPDPPSDGGPDKGAGGSGQKRLWEQAFGWAWGR